MEISEDQNEKKGALAIYSKPALERESAIIVCTWQKLKGRQRRKIFMMKIRNENFKHSLTEDSWTWGARMADKSILYYWRGLYGWLPRDGTHKCRDKN